MNWTKSTLGAITEWLKTGKTPPTKEEKYFNGSVKWYTPGDLDNGKYLGQSKRTISVKAFKDKKAVNILPNCLLVTCIGDIAKLGITTDECSSNQQITAFKPKDFVDVKFLYYWFSKNKGFLQNCANNAVVPIINNGTLTKLPFSYPPLETQKKIAEILDTADTLRQKDKALIEKYNQLTQSLFLEMFGDPVKNEKGWEKFSLEKINKVSSGSTPSRKDDGHFIGNIPWVKTGEIKGGWIMDTTEKISNEALANSSCRVYPVGSILIAMYGQGKTRGKVGILGIEASTNQACAVIPPSDKVNFSFLLNLLKLSYSDLRELGRGGNQPNLNVGMIKNYSIIGPPIELQNKFASMVEAIEKQKQLTEENLKKSEALFNSLLQKAFKGELA